MRKPPLNPVLADKIVASISNDKKTLFRQIDTTLKNMNASLN